MILYLCNLKKINNKLQMKVELKQIIDQLTEAIGLSDGLKVCAIIDNENIIGWSIVEVKEDGTILPIEGAPKYNNIKELFNTYMNG